MLYVYGALGLISGILILKYSYRIRKVFGLDPDMERAFGGMGGTYVFIKLFGLALIIVSLFLMFGLLPISSKI